MSQIVVLHIPHASQCIPAVEREAIYLNDDELQKELLRMTDAYTDQLFPQTPVEAGRVVFPVSRLICDVERFPADEHEPMVTRGMGVVYTRTSTAEVLRAQPDAVTRQSILDRWYWPHHSQLERTVNHVVSQSGVCLIVDCHSFPSVALPYEPNQTGWRADFCVGTDSFHTPAFLRDAIVAAVRDAGYSVAIDVPFAGALVPLSSYRQDHRIQSVMIEVNRRVYMNEHSGRANQQFERVRAAIGQLITTASDAVMHDLRAR